MSDELTPFGEAVAATVEHEAATFTQDGATNREIIHDQLGIDPDEFDHFCDQVAYGTLRYAMELNIPSMIGIAILRGVMAGMKYEAIRSFEAVEPVADAALSPGQLERRALEYVRFLATIDSPAGNAARKVLAGEDWREGRRT